MQRSFTAKEGDRPAEYFLPTCQEELENITKIAYPPEKDG